MHGCVSAGAAHAKEERQSPMKRWSRGSQTAAETEGKWKTEHCVESWHRVKNQYYEISMVRQLLHSLDLCILFLF